MFTPLGHQHRPPERSGRPPSPPPSAPKRKRPYVASIIVVSLLWSLPAIAVQWYAVSIDSGMYSRISLVMAQSAAIAAGMSTPYRDDGTEERAVVADEHVSLWRQLRLVSWGRCAIAYAVTAAIAAAVLVADAHGHAIAFPTLSVCLVAFHAAWSVSKVQDSIRQAPAVVWAALLSVPTGLFVGGTGVHGYWIYDPWCWTAVALVVSLLLRLSRSEVTTWFRERLRRRADRVK